jgi:1,2-diacylglycerol 3-beta-galactosyltransferase
MICGHNEKLRAALEKIPRNKLMFVEGFTSDVAHYMSLADFFIGKPGPGSISEALQCGLPVIIESNSKTMPQERYNAEWVTEKGLGIVLNSFSDIAAGVHHLLQRPTFERIRQNVMAYYNRALFEIPPILDEILERHVPYSVPVLPPVTTATREIGQDAAWASLT